MALPTIPNHFYVQAVFDRELENNTSNTFCFEDTRTTGQGNMNVDLAENVRAVLDAFYGTGGTGGSPNAGALLSTDLHALRYVIYNLASPTAGALEIPSDTFRTAATTPAMAPPDMAIVITWRTALRGRSYRGRTYVGPLRTALHDGTGRLSATNADLAAGAAALLLPHNTLDHDLRLTVLSREIPTATRVSGADVDREFDTQRRRGYRHASRVVAPEPTP